MLLATSVPLSPERTEDDRAVQRSTGKKDCVFCRLSTGQVLRQMPASIFYTVRNKKIPVKDTPEMFVSLAH